MNGGTKSSPHAQRVRNLDFFFGKQRLGGEDGDGSQVRTSGDGGSGGLKGVIGSQARGFEDEKGKEKEEGTGLTDEEVARRMQLQWAEEDKEGLRGDRDGKREGEVEGGSTEKPDKIEPKATPKTLFLQSAVESKDTISSTIPFDQSPLTFDPSTYLPELQEQWTPEGGHASYALLTQCFVLVNSTQSRIKIVDTLVNFLRTIIEGDPGSLLPAVSESFTGYPPLSFPPS